jgi:hypothetical protein
MTGVLLDTNVVSELVRPRPDPRIVEFVRVQPDPMISVITLHELTYGAERLPQAARRVSLIAWIASIRAQFANRLIGIDVDTALEAGRLRAAAEAQGKQTEALDALIAASALSRGAAVATRNVADFLPLGVRVINPWGK